VNPYLLRRRARFDELRTKISDLQTAAANAPAETEGGTPGRDLTEAELRSITEWGTEATAVATEIETLTADELRSRQVADLNASLGDATDDGDTHTRSTGNAQTRDRDPGHYRRDGDRSFFADIVRAREGDGDAQTRLQEHNRALSTTVAGAGIVAPKWLTEEYETIARQGRLLAAAVRNLPLGNDPRPITLPRQTLGTDGRGGGTPIVSPIQEQATENTHPAETDSFGTAVDTVVPKPTAGIQVVSRQMLDSTSPAIDALIYADMLAVYNRKVEDKVTAAVVAAATAAGAVTTFATEGDWKGTAPAYPAVDAVTDAAFALWNARKLPATLVAMRTLRWGQFNKFRDTAGRKLFPTSDAGPVNVDGVGTVTAAGSIEGLPVIATDGLGFGPTLGVTSQYPENIVVLRASDTILFEGDMMRFRYEEVAGPESVKLGIWAYTAAIVRQASSSVARIQITQATAP
jgi:hypothetical protein